MEPSSDQDGGPYESDYRYEGSDSGAADVEGVPEAQAKAASHDETSPKLKHSLALHQLMTKMGITLQEARADRHSKRNNQVCSSAGCKRVRTFDTTPRGLDAAYNEGQLCELQRALEELLQLLRPPENTGRPSRDLAATEEGIRIESMKSIAGVLLYNELLPILRELLWACCPDDLECHANLCTTLLKLVGYICSWRCLHFILVHGRKDGSSLIQILKDLKNRAGVLKMFPAAVEPAASAVKRSREIGPGAVQEGGSQKPTDQLPTIAPAAQLLLDVIQQTSEAAKTISTGSGPVFVGSESPAAKMPEVDELSQYLSSAGTVTCVQEMGHNRGPTFNGWRCRVSFECQSQAAAAASTLDGKKLGEQSLVVRAYSDVMAGLVEVGPGTSDETIQGALAGSLCWEWMADSNGENSSYVLARFISVPIGDDVREIANKLGTEQKTIEEFQEGRSGSRRVRITNIDFKVKERKLRTVFQAAGPVVSVELKKNPRGASTGKAWVTFAEPAGAATAAEELDGVVVGKRNRGIRVKRTRPSSRAV